MEGLPNDEAWVSNNNLAPRIHLIKVPTFGFGSYDDLIVDGKCVPEEQVRQSDSPVMIANTTTGGHASFITGRIFPKSWYQYPATEFLDFMEARVKKEAK